jgi:hypothetical protein
LFFPEGSDGKFGKGIAVETDFGQHPTLGETGSIKIVTGEDLGPRAR